jgi:2-amino-4-hydroxy-6-hydroxymethyldihydropteridine diphosphokinase
LQISPKKAWIAIGTNQGNSLALYGKAVKRLGYCSGLRLVACSSLYKTQPVGPIRQPWFINGVVVVESVWGAQTLLRKLHHIEAIFGRNRRREKRWGPRRLDLDLLFYDQQIISRPTLEIPHPRLHLRPFVLIPLVELSPTLRHPVLGKTVDFLLQNINNNSRVERILP